MDSFLVYISICCCLVMSTDAVTLTLEMKSILPLKGSSLELSCRISEPFNINGILVWKGNSQLTLCYGDGYYCDFYKTSYSFTTNSTGSFGTISSLTTEDEGIWRCSYRSPREDTFSNPWNLTVYTIPSGLSITQDPNQNVDLSVQSVVLQCKTTGCTYPMPTVQWIFQDQTTSSDNYYTTNNPTGTQGTCVTQEKIYTSILNLPLYTTLNDNSDKTGTFSCRIEYPDSSRNIIAHASNTVRFAVRVIEAVLQQNNQNITGTLNVTSTEPVTLTCVTGTSRPTPTIDWYIGSRKIASGVSLTYIFSNMDHNEMIYCQAYNTDPSRPVSSAKPRLFVQVRVTEAVLQQNNQNITETLNVTSTEPVTLTCVTGTSRPTPTIDWYIGSQKIAIGVSLTYTFSNMDHNEMIYCQAYNTDPGRPVSSAKPRLFVQVSVTNVTIASKNGTVVFYEGVSQSLSCTSSPSRPVPTIRWWLGNSQVTDNITVLDTTDASAMHVITSNVTLVMMSDRTNQTIYCDGFISSQVHPATSKQLIVVVWFTPDKPTNFHASNIQEKQLSLMWQYIYHGGFTQTFVVEISLDNMTWNNVSEVSAGNRDGWFTTVIEDLIPGSQYYLRLYAYNIHGRGEFADEQPVIRMLKESTYIPSLEVGASVGISVGGVVGVGVGGLVLGFIGAVIAFRVRRRLKGPKSSCFRSKGKTEEEMHPYSNTEMNPQNVKPIYEELNKGNTEQRVYDKISPL